MESMRVKSNHVIYIARYLLTLYASAFKSEQQAHWVWNKQCLQETLSQFLDPQNLLPGETVIDSFDRSLSSLNHLTQWLVDQLAAETLQELNGRLPN